MLNGTIAREAARSLSLRISREAATAEGRVERAYLLAIGRSPDTIERRIAADFLGKGEAGAFDDFCLAMVNLNEFVYVD